MITFITVYALISVVGTALVAVALSAVKDDSVPSNVEPIVPTPSAEKKAA